MRDRQDDSTHRRVLEAKLGRKLLPTEVAHHVNEDKAANQPANLEPQSRAAHTAQHNRTRSLSTLRAALRMQKSGKKLY